MDNQQAEPIEEVSDLEKFSNFLNPKEESSEQEKPEEDKPEEVEETEEDEPSEEQKIEIEVDGKKVELTPAQIAEAYKNGLRQDDYTRKTQQISEERKQVDAERQKATQERNEYANQLNTYSQQLGALIQQQQQINWNELLEADPVEFLKQKHLFDERQAEFKRANDELSKVGELQQRERDEFLRIYMAEQSEKLLEKLPAWKDQEKARAERTQLKQFMKDDGFTDDEIGQITDHRHVLLIRDAMMFRKLLKESPEATKKVASAPAKAERSGTSNETNTSAKQQAIKAFKRNPTDKAATDAFSAIL